MKSSILLLVQKKLRMAQITEKVSYMSPLDFLPDHFVTTLFVTLSEIRETSYSTDK